MVVMFVEGSGLQVLSHSPDLQVVAGGPPGPVPSVMGEQTGIAKRIARAKIDDRELLRENVEAIAIKIIGKSFKDIKSKEPVELIKPIKDR